ncbi:serine/threonine-protein kinase RsbT [Pseudophaeobacter arcticus]|jgi:serine/threonine-protein kinase RsbT|uniref:Serine/threonine-protein kinase RsbT n=2 Tax=Paracoccaceae TaxID=31989 RepID=A0ABQ0AHZ6_9RHOB
MKMAGGVPDIQLRRITTDSDIVAARKLGRNIAESLGFSRPDQALVATAISELARNIVNYAGKGEIQIAVIQDTKGAGILVRASDQGPGIKDLSKAMQDGFSTGNSLGLGLPGTKRIMDEFDISSQPGEGVLVVAAMWCKP